MIACVVIRLESFVSLFQVAIAFGRGRASQRYFVRDEKFVIGML